MAKKPYAYAIMEGVRQEMQANPLLSICNQGGLTASLPTGQVINLAKEFPGPRTSGAGWAIDEGWYAGWGAGMAAAGVPVIVRLPYMAALIPFEYIFNNVAKLRHMTGGQGTQPVVLWIGGAARVKGQAGQHTDVGQESLYAYVAGLKVVAPSNAYDAKGLMITAIRSGDPVCFFDFVDVAASEPVEVPDEAYEIPFGKASIIQEGKDITVVGWGPSVVEAKKALPEIAKAGISVELIDLRSLKPMDLDALVASTNKTKKLLVVDQGNYTNGFGSHVISEVAQVVSGAQLKKIAFPDAPGPGAAEMMDWMRPDAPKIIDAVMQMTKA
jgi:pyruvate dehydrogenase E1 component beta subunit